ncbi:MAG: sulfite exporter TauE/SafE family protein [Candidatus Limnocylindrales bacterium]
MVVGLLMLMGGVAAGAFGSLLGLGGGVLIVPLLTLGFGLPLREAVGVSLVCVIMTSSAAAGVYLERHVANLRLGMTLELFTALGALIGGSIAFLLDERLLALLFAGLLAYVAATMVRAALRAPAVPTAVASGSPGRAARGDRCAARGSPVCRPVAWWTRRLGTSSGGFPRRSPDPWARASCPRCWGSVAGSSRSR